MKCRILLLPLAIAVGAAAGACGNPNATTATVANRDDTAGVFALTGAPTSGPTAVDIWLGQPLRAAPNTQEHWDVVFDIDSTQAIAMPPSVVAWNPAFSAGLQATTMPYDQITVAPTSGYHDSTALNIQAGTVFFIQSFTYGCATQAVVARRYAYAKMIIDSVHYYPYDPITAPAGRVIYYRMRSDPNCGFTSLEPGLPTF